MQSISSTLESSSPTDAPPQDERRDSVSAPFGHERTFDSDDTVRLDPAERRGDTCVAFAPSSTPAEAALAVLAQSGVAELRFLRVDESEGEIHLSGRVRSFYHKQLAQEAVRPVAGGRQVINRVDVAIG